MSRDELMLELEKKGIETRMFFIPIEGLHPLYPCVQLTDGVIYVSKANVRCKMDEAEELARKGMYLPSSSGLKEDEITYICNVMKGIKKDDKVEKSNSHSGEEYLNPWRTK